MGYGKGGVQIHDNSDDHKLSFPKFKIRASRCCAAVQEKGYMIRLSQENSNVSVCSVKLHNSKHSGKNVVDSLISQKEFFSSVFTTFASSLCLTEDSILAEVKCQLAVSEV